MPTYRKADKSADALVAETVKKHHKPLKDAGVTISCLFAFPTRDENGTPKGPAITHHGYPAAAVVKVNGLKDRVEGKADATILIDGEKWQEGSDAWRAALIDHELTHLEVKLEDPNRADSFKLDDANRPCLKCRPHDFEIGGFHDVIERHKADALEYRQVIDVNRTFTQREFNWG